MSRTIPTRSRITTDTRIPGTMPEKLSGANELIDKILSIAKKRAREAKAKRQEGEMDVVGDKPAVTLPVEEETNTYDYDRFICLAADLVNEEL